MIRIKPGLSIPDEEIEFRVSRSSGPGGQHVNKVNSRVALRFDISGSRSLSPGQKSRLLTHLASRVTKSGILQIVSQSRRSQHANREELVDRFVQLVRSALARRKIRRKTTVPAGSRRRRVDDKRARGQLKRNRSGVRSVDDD